MPYPSLRTSLFLILPALLFVAVALVIPLIVLLQSSLEAGDFLTGNTHGPTLANYVEVLTDGYYLSVMWRTFWISALATAIALAAALPLAAKLARSPSHIRSPLTVLILSPLLVSMVASSYGWIVILGDSGLINGLLIQFGVISEPIKLLYTNGSIVVGLVHIVIPFMVLTLMSSLDRIDPQVSEAAATLGANPIRVWIHIIIPLCIPAIGAGITIVFALCIASYVTPAVLGPSGPNFITTLIYQNFISLYEWGVGSVLAIILLVVSAAIVFLLGLVTSRLSPTRRRT